MIFNFVGRKYVNIVRVGQLLRKVKIIEKEVEYLFVFGVIFQYFQGSSFMLLDLSISIEGGI